MPGSRDASPEPEDPEASGVAPASWRYPRSASRSNSVSPLPGAARQWAAAGGGASPPTRGASPRDATAEEAAAIERRIKALAGRPQIKEFFRARGDWDVAAPAGGGDQGAGASVTPR